jgi:plastocyanin
MRHKLILIALALGAGALFPDVNVNIVAAQVNEKVAIVDDCDPNADWGLNGCLREEGSVTNAEFAAFLASPLSPTTVVGHPSWRMDPAYLTVEAGERVRVRNRGGRNHTFTKVAQFGGGNVPQLRVGLMVAPECPAAVIVRPDGKAEVNPADLTLGDNRFQCCIHSWMRGVIKVVPGEGEQDQPKK